MPRTRTTALAIVASITMLLPLAARAADIDGVHDDRSELAVAIAVPPPTTYPVYLVPYMRGGDLSATVVSVTNVGNAACTTSVDWKVGVGGVACRTFLRLASGSPVGDTLDHCTNPNVVGCNATCPQPDPWGFRAEGAAIVGAEAHCRGTIAVDARVYYFTAEGEVSGVADLKIIKLPSGNKGE